MADCEAKELGKLKGIGTIFQAPNASLNEQIESFERKGIAPDYLVSPEEAALAQLNRLYSGGTRTSMVPLSAEGESPLLWKGPYWTKANVNSAVLCHKNGHYVLASRELFEVLKQTAQSEKQQDLEPEDRTVQALEKTGEYKVGKTSEDARFIFGLTTEEYFDKNELSDITIYGLPVPKDKSLCYINHGWLDAVQSGSGFSCRRTSLYCDSPALGVLRKSAEGASQKSSVSLSRTRKTVSDSLEEVLEKAGLSVLSDRISPATLSRKVLAKLREKQ